jgi:ribonuclease HII
VKYLVGVDEAGRGPLAGPVAVGVVKVVADFDWSLLPKVDDSKKLHPAVREEIFKETQKLRRAGLLEYAVGLSAAKVIDVIGIVPAIKRAQGQAFAKLDLAPADCFIKLDGSLKAPAQFAQETIIKGDSKEKIIGLASILAKVTRDRYMVRKSALPIFAPYTFAAHKGYGTKLHRAEIETYGLSAEHRVSFCRAIHFKKAVVRSQRN